MKELWVEKKTGRFVIVYERFDGCARMQQFGFNDMAEQGHQQVNEPAFSNEYEFSSYLMREE